MSLITNQNSEAPVVDNSGQVGNVQPVEKIDPTQSEQFSDLVAQEQNQAASGAEGIDSNAISPEELQRQIQENLFKNGFNKAMERAKEIAKELKDG